MICRLNSRNVKRYLDDVGRLVIAHADCARVENIKTKHEKKLCDLEWKMFRKNFSNRRRYICPRPSCLHSSEEEIHH